MSKRSPFWRPFSARTPLGYAIAGFFNTEPSRHYGSLRVTHVDGQLPRPYVLPGLPEAARAEPSARGGALPAAALVDLRAVERADGTLVGFYPLFDGEGALVEVLARTRDTVIVQDTPWRPLAALTARARHAGIEEAVRRQRGIFVFQLVGLANPRLVRYPFELKFVLQQVVRGTGRTAAPYGQVRGWANQYGLDLPATLAQFDPRLDAAARELPALEQRWLAPGAEPGALPSSGALLWASERAAATLLDLPAVRRDDAAGVSPVHVWDAMARLADRGEAPTREVVAAALARDLPGATRAGMEAAIAAAWERWACRYPEALASAAVPVAV